MGTGAYHTQCWDTGCTGTGMCHTQCPPLALPGGELCAQGDVTVGRDAAPVGQVTGGGMGTAVHLVLAARCLRAPDPVTTVAAAGRCPPVPVSVPAAWGSTPRHRRASRSRWHCWDTRTSRRDTAVWTQQRPRPGPGPGPGAASPLSSWRREHLWAAAPPPRARASVSLLTAQGWALPLSPAPTSRFPFLFCGGGGKPLTPPPLTAASPAPHPMGAAVPDKPQHKVHSSGQGAACQGGP